MTVSPEVPVDGRVLASRFARQPVVSNVEVQRGSDLEDGRAVDATEIVAA
jgi:hypothetical protein